MKMREIMFKSVRLLAIFLILGSIAACNKKSETSADQQKTEEIVKNYIMAHPEVLVQSLTNYQQNQAEEQEKAAGAMVASKHDELFNNPNSPVYGNPKGSIQLVEFFDYNCGYCVKMLPDLIKLVDTDKNVKIIFKELPILGPTSQTAGLASLAVHDIAPDKYFPFHAELLMHRGPKDEAAIKAAAAKAGIDGAKLLEKMKDKKYEGVMEKNVTLAHELSIRGTPAYVLDDKVISGAIGYDGLKQAIAEMNKPPKS